MSYQMLGRPEDQLQIEPIPTGGLNLALLQSDTSSNRSVENSVEFQAELLPRDIVPSPARLRQETPHKEKK